MQRIAILYSKLAGYSAACQRELKKQTGAELLVIHWTSSSEAPFRSEIYDHIDYRYERDNLSARQITEILSEFNPDVILISGWMDKDYLKAARSLKKRGVKVIAGSDTQWNGSIRQQIGKLIAPFYLHTAIDVLWVTGDRQRHLAEKLGFKDSKCMTGFYACDWEKFNQAPKQEKNKAFLYVGRYIERKGIKILLDSYAKYRQEVDQPWELWMAGSGPLRDLIIEQDGVVDLGFVQPDEIPILMKRSSAFVLPSLYEPWGVVLQEAASAGLPLIASDACGASVHLIREERNGWTYRAKDTAGLKALLKRVSSLSSEESIKFGDKSSSLARQFTPALWSEKLINLVNGSN